MGKKKQEKLSTPVPPPENMLVGNPTSRQTYSSKYISPSFYEFTVKFVLLKNSFRFIFSVMFFSLFDLEVKITPL